jgi:outer membrane protein assembly factor BamD
MYYQGESHFLSRNYTEAIPAFEKVITEYPASAFGDRSQYRLGLCYYKESPSWELDQVMTEKAIEVFRVFLVKYPQSPLLPEVNRIIMACQDKLAHKRWDSGRIYLSMKFYNSARIYFKNTRDEYPESIWSRKAALGLAECDYQEKYYDKARIGFEALLGDSSKVIREKAGSRLKDITVFLDKSFPSKKKK